MLYKKHEQQEQYRKILDIIIAKHRNGPIGNFQLLFHTDTCKFSDITKSHLMKLHKRIA